MDLQNDASCTILKPLKAGGVSPATGVPHKAAIVNVGKIESFQGVDR